MAKSALRHSVASQTTRSDEVVLIGRVQSGDASLKVGPVNPKVVELFTKALPGTTRVVTSLALGGPAAKNSTPRFLVSPVESNAGVNPDEFFGGAYFDLNVVDQNFLDAYPQPEQVHNILSEDGIVLLADSSGEADVVMQWYGDSPDDVTPSWKGRVHVARGDVQSLSVQGNEQTLLVTPSMVERLGLVSVPARVSFRSSSGLSASQREAADFAADDARYDLGQQAFFDMNYATNVFPVGETAIEGLLAATAFLLALFVIATSLALSAAETRDERNTLAVVGASPAIMQRSSAIKTWLLATLGALLAIPVGLAPVAVFMKIQKVNQGRLDVPWPTVLSLLVAIPLAAALVTWLGSVIALRFRPIRVSTMATD